MRWSEDSAEPVGNKAVSVTVATRQDLMADLQERLRSRSGFCLATLNLDHVVKLSTLPEFSRAYLEHSHVTADGNPIVWLSRLAGQPVELVPGSELVEPVAALAAATGTRVALFGSTQETLDRATQVLGQRCPGLEVAVTLAPPMGFDPAGAVADDYIEQLRASGVGLCFLALGAPKQEIFAARASRALPQMGFLSIGAGLDFLSGRQQRAPRLVRGLAGEWLWRLAHDPRRLGGRYAACIAILPRLVGRALRTRWSRA